MDTLREATQTSGRKSSRQRLVSWLRRPHAAVATAGALLGLLYLAALRPLLMPAGATVYVELGVIVLLVLGFLVTTLAALGLLVATGVAGAVPRMRATRPRWYARANRVAFTALFLLAGFIIAALVNDQLTYAPSVRDATGDEIADGIASLEKIELGGTTQYLTIRGQNPDNPVLLFLAGGPGGSELVKTRYEDTGRALEEHFVVVNWDQPGAGKSWNAMDTDDLTPEVYREHALELTNELRARFDEEKIYVLGDSWGSALGLWLVDEHPELFHAYIGADQMVAFVENDLMMYEAALDHARDTGDTATAATLEKNGPPPYHDDPTLQMMPMSMETTEAMGPWDVGGHNMALDNPLAPEYGFIDTVGQLWALYSTFNEVYPQLYEVDFRTDVADLEVPAYFLAGRHDLNAFQTLTEDYYEGLEAPHKEFHWFEQSGHNVVTEQPEELERVLVERVLAQTYAER
ncbi:MAG TPA: alpha/beta hydrolase [Thermoleophilia bacterium]|nr:alpha/beta hydrolase [Thermoleophilia bacterium]